MEVKIVGTQFKSLEAREMLKNSSIGTPVIFKRDPHNIYDKFAVKVLLIKTDSDMFKDVGFVAKEQARIMTGEWSNGWPCSPYMQGEIVAKKLAKVMCPLSSAELAIFASNYRLGINAVHGISEADENATKEQGLIKHPAFKDPDWSTATPEVQCTIKPPVFKAPQ